MRATSGWRTTSTDAKRVVAMPGDASQDALGLDQPAQFAARQIDLADVAGDHAFAAEADARQEHLHLLGRRVLRLVEDHEGIVQRAPAHEGQRRNLDQALLEGPRHLVETHQVVQRVVERAQIRVDLLRQIAGQEAEPLAGLDRRPGEDDALHRAALERIDRTGHRQEGLAGTGGPMPKLMSWLRMLPR